MQIYHYHPITGVFLCADLADPDPLDEGNFLIPACATSIEPPEQVEGKLIVFTNGIWEYAEIIDDEIIPESAGPIEIQVNQELADAYEAIASLYEMNVQLQARLEVLENGV